MSDLSLDSDVWAVINGQNSQLLVESKAKHPGLSGALDLMFHAKFDLADAATLPKEVQGMVSIILQAKKGLIYKLVQDSGYPVTSQLVQAMAELMMLRSFGKNAESTGEFDFVDFNRLLFHLIDAGRAGGSKRLNKSEEILFAAIEEDLDVRVKLPDGRTVPPLLGSNSVTQAANMARFQYTVETAYSHVHYLSYVDYTRCICMLEGWNTPLVWIRRFIRTFMGALVRVDEDIESQLKGGRKPGNGSWVWARFGQDQGTSCPGCCRKGRVCVAFGARRGGQEAGLGGGRISAKSVVVAVHRSARGISGYEPTQERKLGMGTVLARSRHELSGMLPQG